VNWVYQILKALLDWLRETPPPSILQSKAPDGLKEELGSAIDAARAGRMPDEGDPRP
jgi:hypothetical protein